MTLQKAMRIRSELKKEATALSSLIDNTDYEVQFKGDEPSAEEVQQKQAEKLPSLDGKTYAAAVKRMFTIAEACQELNIAIEAVNRKGHELLYKEAAIKAKLAVVESLLAKERRIKPVSVVQETDYEHSDSRGAYLKVERTVYSYPYIRKEDFGMSLPELKKKLGRELVAVRDELSEFNASKTVDYSLPEELL